MPGIRLPYMSLAHAHSGPMKKVLFISLLDDGDRWKHPAFGRLLKAAQLFSRGAKTQMLAVWF